MVGITGACENIDTLFRIGNREGRPLFFTQTGQLTLEFALIHFPAVYTVIRSGRDEEREDKRHLREFSLTEEEFDWTRVGRPDAVYNEEVMYAALLNRIEKAVKRIARGIIEENQDIL